MVKFKLYDLSHSFSIHSVPFMGYPSPIIHYVKRQPAEGVYAQMVMTTMHVGTHIDSPLHWLGPGAKDMASISLDRLFGPGVIVDLRDICEDWYIIKPEDIISRVKVKEEDVLIINTGYHKYYESDESRYMCRHPGPGKKFAEWALKMKLRWIGVDCASADHPMNTNATPKFRPDFVKEFEAKTGKRLEEVFPRNQVHPMHDLLFPHDIIHAENVGGEIDSLSNQLCYIGAFPWKFVGGDGSICRIVAFVVEE